MAENKKRDAKIGGPFLAAAVFCESIIEDSSGMLSVTHMMDSIRFVIPSFVPADVPSKSKPIPLQVNILLMFKTGDSRKNHTLVLRVEQPNGKRSIALRKSIELSPGPNGGCNVKTNAALKVFSSGVFWFDVILDRKVMTRMPIDIQIDRQAAPGN